MALQLYHNNMSVCAQKVRLALAENGQPAEEIHLDLRAADQQNPDYLKLNPKGYVPTLIHDGTVVTESTIICEYLDEIFPAPPLKPDTAAGQTAMRSWTRRPDERIHDACVTISNCLAFRHQWLSRPADELADTIAKTPDPDIRARRVDVIENGTNSLRFKSGILAYDRLFKDMEAALSQSRYLVPDTYSLADIGLIPYVNRITEL
ncbi:MAG: glutathione S-transferase family protein, partial [Proteobacteria bacterium]|nr:glutathione S-transferase family protein [Pseudomonadota bacterium]